MQAQSIKSSAAAVSVNDPFIRRIWPPAAIAGALGLTAAWISFLGYVLLSLIGVGL